MPTILPMPLPRLLAKHCADFILEVQFALARHHRGDREGGTAR